MRLPQFTAKACLSSSENFRQIPAQHRFGSSALVTPQLPMRFRTLPDGGFCYTTCVEHQIKGYSPYYVCTESCYRGQTIYGPVPLS